MTREEYNCFLEDTSVIKLDRSGALMFLNKSENLVVSLSWDMQGWWQFPQYNFRERFLLHASQSNLTSETTVIEINQSVNILVIPGDVDTAVFYNMKINAKSMQVEFKLVHKPNIKSDLITEGEINGIVISYV